MIRSTLTLLAACAVAVAGPREVLEATEARAKPVDQLMISGNACGPAALLNALHFGKERWRAVAEALPAESDRSRMSYIIRAHCLRPSEHMADRLRWERKNGINLLDLKDVANELQTGRILPPVRHAVFVRKHRESDHALLRRAHSSFAKSLKAGLPPIISLRRLARPGAIQEGAPTPWRAVHGHYVVVIAIPPKLPRGATSLEIHYVDPWGGRLLKGTVRADPNSGFPSLLADVPDSAIGRSKLAAGETSIVSLAAAIGAF